MSQDEPEPFRVERALGRSPQIEELITESVDVTENDVEVTTRVYNDRVEIIERHPGGGLKVEVRPDVSESPE